MHGDNYMDLFEPQVFSTDSDDFVSSSSEYFSEVSSEGSIDQTSKTKQPTVDELLNLENIERTANPSVVSGQATQI